MKKYANVIQCIVDKYIMIITLSLYNQNIEPGGEWQDKMAKSEQKCSKLESVIIYTEN